MRAVDRVRIARAAVRPRTAVEIVRRVREAFHADQLRGPDGRWIVSYSLSPYPGESQPMHHWSAKDSTSGEVVGGLWADPETGQIMQVETAPHRRREGVATALYQAASGQVSLYHSPTEHRTPDGHRWAKAVGGVDIPENLAYQP